MQTKLINLPNFSHLPGAFEGGREGTPSVPRIPAKQQTWGPSCGCQTKAAFVVACPLRKAEDPSGCDSGLNSESGTLSVTVSWSRGFYTKLLFAQLLRQQHLSAQRSPGGQRECTGQSLKTLGDTTLKEHKTAEESTNVFMFSYGAHAGLLNSHCRCPMMEVEAP